MKSNMGEECTLRRPLQGALLRVQEQAREDVGVCACALVRVVPAHDAGLYVRGCVCACACGPG